MFALESVRKILQQSQQCTAGDAEKKQNTKLKKRWAETSNQIPVWSYFCTEVQNEDCQSCQHFGNYQQSYKHNFIAFPVHLQCPLWASFAFFFLLLLTGGIRALEKIFYHEFFTIVSKTKSDLQGSFQPLLWFRTFSVRNNEKDGVNSCKHIRGLRNKFYHSIWEAKASVIVYLISQCIFSA